MEENQRFEEIEKQEVFSKSVRAGKRTYYFDVKTTRKNDFYLTITERKKRMDENGKFLVEKHKIFLYKEDFDKFSDVLHEALDYINTSENEDNSEIEHTEVTNKKFTDIKFEDLDK